MLDITRQPGPTRVEPQPTTVTAVQALVKPTIHRLEPTHAARQPPMPMAARAQLRPTTQGPGPPPPRSKAPMPTAAGAVRPFRRTATPPTASTRRQLRAQPDRYKPRTGEKPLVRRVSTTAGGWRRPLTATSMRPRTAPNTKTPAAGGRLIRAEAGIALRNPVVPVHGARTHPREDGADKRKPAVRRPSAARVVEVGTPGQQVLADGEVAAGVAVGAVVAAASAGRFQIAAKNWRSIVQASDLYLGRMLCSATPADLQSQRNRCFSP